MNECKNCWMIVFWESAHVRKMQFKNPGIKIWLPSRDLFRAWLKEDKSPNRITAHWAAYNDDMAQLSLLERFSGLTVFALTDISILHLSSLFCFTEIQSRLEDCLPILSSAKHWCTGAIQQRSKKSQLSGRQNFARKNLPDKVHNFVCRHLCQMPKVRFHNIYQKSVNCFRFPDCLETFQAIWKLSK